MSDIEKKLLLVLVSILFFYFFLAPSLIRALEIEDNFSVEIRNLYK